VNVLGKTAPIQVIALDDHYLIREGIRSVLAAAQDIILVAEGVAGEQLEPLVASHHPDIVLLDLEMPQTIDSDDASFQALPAITHLRQHYPQTRVIILSQHATPALVEGAVTSEVGGYLLKDDELSLCLAEAIRTVHRGGLYLSGSVARRLRQASRVDGEVLTERQQQIFWAIVAAPDLSYAAHAQKLGISEHTFSNHLRQIFERMDVSNITAAIVKAIRLGIVSVDTG
jgi:DNA-binding NarL/FixJ family response regulator